YVNRLLIPSRRRSLPDHPPHSLLGLHRRLCSRRNTRFPRDNPVVYPRTPRLADQDTQLRPRPRNLSCRTDTETVHTDGSPQHPTHPHNRNKRPVRKPIIRSRRHPEREHASSLGLVRRLHLPSMVQRSNTRTTRVPRLFVTRNASNNL